MSLASLLAQIARRVQPVSAQDREQQTPLNAFTADDDDYLDSTQDYGQARYRKRPGARCSIATGRWKTAALIFVAILGLWQLAAYLYSDPERWDPSWYDVLWGPRPVDVPTLVRAADRRFQGERYDGRNVVAWRGIRFAKPPTGKRRFRNPVPLRLPKLQDGEEGEFVNATRYDEGCARPHPEGLGGFIGSEDCLSLSVYAPRKQVPGVKLPIMFWIHGGGFYAGAATEERYDPKDLIERSLRMNQPFIFVSANYRLHALGFSASPPPPGPPPIPPHIPVGPPVDLDLNVGFKDQLLALQWVRANIESFGGDREKVTLVGHSAGAMSVGLHQLYSPPHLFRAAFMLSGAPTSFPVPYPHDAAARTIHPLPEHCDCPWPVPAPNGPPDNADLIECLRQLPLPDLMRSLQFFFERAPVNGYFPWYPVLEGEWQRSWLDVRPSDRIVRGTFSKVPVVMGAVRDEGTRFTSPDIQSQDDILQALRGAFDFTFGAIETILTPIWELYPAELSLGSPYGTGNETFGLSPAFKRAASILGDVLFQAPRRHFLRETPKDFGEPSWNFLYDESRPGAEARNGAQHGADLDSWFAHPATSDLELHSLSRHMTAYLINFIANLDPNGPGLRPWPQYGMDRRTLHLGRHNITITHDNARLEAMHFINDNNPLFAR